MFKNRDLIYIQMQKTASTNIADLLLKTVGGELIGKHNPATEKQAKSGIYCAASIRNPWDWYLSLWCFGVGGRGALMKHLTCRKPTKTLLKNPKLLLGTFSKSAKMWRGLYTKSADVVAFRRWLMLILQSDNQILGEGVGHQNSSSKVGLMTHRYLNLHCLKSSQHFDFTDFSQLLEFENKTCYIDFFIRQERLSTDLYALISKFQSVNEAQKQLIFDSKKTNTSERALPIKSYYDQESADLIQKSERLIIEKFSYQSPHQI